VVDTSLDEEGDEGVGDVLSCELEMVTFNLDELNLLGFVKGLEADGIGFIPITILKGHDLHEVVKALEPLRLFRVNHGVLIEHHSHQSVDGREASLNCSLISILSSLIVKEAKEYRAGKISLHMMRITEITSRTNYVLDLSEIDHLANHEVNHLAEFTTEAVRDISYSHVRSSNSKNVADFHISMLEGTSLSNMTGKETTLGKSSNIELTFESFIGVESFTGGISLLLEILEDRSLRSISNLNTNGISSSLLCNLTGEVLHSRIDTGISKTMEDSSGNSGSSSA
jgi:hypothetical protein